MQEFPLSRSKIYVKKSKANSAALAAYVNEGDLVGYRSFSLLLCYIIYHLSKNASVLCKFLLM